MNAKPTHKRDFQSFLSHAHADKAIVDRLYAWLKDTAGIPVWYDAANLPTGTMIGTYLSEAITDCRSLIIVLSKASVQSGWVKEEYNAALGQRTQFPDFRIIPIRVEECEEPGFLQTTKWLDIQDGRLSIETANELLQSLYYDDVDLGLGKNRDIYISRTWRKSEAVVADAVCRQLVEAGFRLIGDSEDQEGFDEGQRVESIISSCGALVAILPDRGQGATSKYMLREIEIASRLQLPFLVVKESTVDLPGEPADQAMHIVNTKTADEGESVPSSLLQNAIESLQEEWQSPEKPHFVFFGTDFDDEHEERNRAIRQTVQRVTAMPCVMGDELRTGEIQRVITQRIQDAFMMIADISAENINTCIEAGIARGANTRFHLLASEPRQRPPFMFRDQQVWHYADKADLLGKVHRIVYPYRRRVLNWELS